MSTYTVKALPVGEANGPSLFGANKDPRKLNVLNVDCSNAKEIFGSIVKGIDCNLSGTLTEFHVQVVDPANRQWVTKQRISCARSGSFQLCYTYTISASNGVFSITLARTSTGLSVCFGFALMFFIGFLVFIILGMVGHRSLFRQKNGGAREFRQKNKVSGQPPKV